MSDFIVKVEGKRKNDTQQTREQWEMVRALSFNHAIMQGREIKNGHITPQRYWPFPWDEKTGLAGLTTKEERQNAIKELQRRYLEAAKLSNN